MKTLEKQIIKVLADRDYMLNGEITTLSDVVEYLDMMNDADEDDYYSPEDWFRDTKVHYPEYLISKQEYKDKCYTPILTYLAKQRDLCIDQTGCVPCMVDYEGAIDCDEFKSMLKSKEIDPNYCNVTISDLFNYLLDYWNNN